MTEVEHLADRLLAIRTKHMKLSQQEVADNLGVSIGTIRNYERGKRSPDAVFLKKFSDFYRVSIEYLIKGASAKNYIFNEDGFYIAFDPTDYALNTKVERKLMTREVTALYGRVWREMRSLYVDRNMAVPDDLPLDVLLICLEAFPEEDEDQDFIIDNRLDRERKSLDRRSSSVRDTDSLARKPA